MNHKVFKTLEYDKVKEMLKGHATSDAGRRLCEELEPMTDLSEINQAQQETADAFARLMRRGNIDFSGLVNPNDKLRRLEIGATLNTKELLSICKMLDIARQAKSYAREVREDLPKDSLQSLFDGLQPLTPLAEEIRRCIISEDEVADEASPALHQIRRSMKGINDKIHASMNHILNSSAGRTYLQDTIITMRHGRYCLPVKAEYKAQVPGMVHDQSSSGNTLFIEPMAVVKLNNDLRDAFAKEAEEIDRILADLSNQTGEYSSALESDFRLLERLDFIFAKGKLAKDMNAMIPDFNTDGIIQIRRGRHPLLDPHKVVPIDVRLGEDFKLLIVTGPNTGGKTVSLKTVGLLTLMGQSGLHIPAGAHSRLSVFKEVYADIGDEQSIEQSLSTFSSHMTNIVHILQNADSRSLVLFDELCAGTDPDEGAALAASILEYLRGRNICTMATTHYSELKIYALSTENVENACCEFDVETLSPTYRLLIGIPGKSNAFAISQKLGLPAALIDDAKQRISQETESFEDVIADLEQSRHTIEKEQLEIASYKKNMEDMKRQLEEQKEKLANSKDKILQEANEQAAAILRDAKDVADKTIRNFRKYGKNGLDMAAMERDRDKVRRKMDKASQNAGARRKKKKVENNNVPKNLRIGDTVRVLSMNMKGTVHTLPDRKGDLMVQMGILRYKVNVRDLVRVNDDAPGRAMGRNTSMGKLRMSKSAHVSAELNLIGKRVDEALPILDKYLDDAYLAHLKSVRIVHGKGTGALRKAVHEDLKRQKTVKSYHLGEYGEGDVGVTIVEFK